MRRLISARVVVFGCLLALSPMITYTPPAQSFHCRKQCVIVQCIVQQQGNQTAQITGGHVIRAIIVSDDNTTDSVFNRDLKEDRNSLIELLNTVGPEYVGTSTFLVRKNVTRDTVLRTIQGLPVGKDDVLFFYYNGHGAIDESRAAEPNKGHFFDLMNNERLYREDVLQAMREKNCRLMVLLSDCCSASSGTSDENTIGNRSRLKAKQLGVGGTELNSDVFRHLFLEHQGLVNINSCKPKEVAYGGIFTPLFVSEIKTWDKPGPSPTWADFFDDIGTKTADRFKDKVGTVVLSNSTNAKAKEATIVKIDAANGSLAVKMKEKEDERTLKLPDTVQYLDSAGKEATLDIFKKGDLVLVVEDEGKVKVLQKEDEQTTQTPYSYADINKDVQPFTYDPNAGKTDEGQAADASGPSPAPVATAGPAILRVEVPADARIFVDGVFIPTAGTVRSLQTPSLEPGFEYSYTLKVERTVNGATLETSRKTWVRAGQVVALDLTSRDLYQAQAPLPDAAALAAKAGEK